jgi:hypothetical protein
MPKSLRIGVLLFAFLIAIAPAFATAVVHFFQDFEAAYVRRVAQNSMTAKAYSLVHPWPNLEPGECFFRA